MTSREHYERLTQSTAKAVGRELWDCAPLEVEHAHYARFVHEQTGFRFGWSCRGYGAERQARMMNVGPIAPPSPVPGRYIPLPDGPRIHFDPLRPAKEIANDIRRRFLTPWLKLWPDVTKREHAEIIDYDRCEKLIEHLIDASDGRQLKHHRGEHMMCASFKRIGLGGPWANETSFDAHVVYPDRADLKITNVSAKTAIAIASLLKSAEP